MAYRMIMAVLVFTAAAVMAIADPQAAPLAVVLAFAAGALFGQAYG